MNVDVSYFLSGTVLVTVIPEFTTNEPFRLISGDFGPFTDNGAEKLPIQIPLWMAQTLMKHNKAQLVPPDWLTKDSFQTILENERKEDFFTELPANFFEISVLALSNNARIPNPSSLRNLLDQILSIRMGKARDGMKLLSGREPGFRFPGLSTFELNIIRSNLSLSFKLFSQLAAGGALGEAVASDSQNLGQVMNMSDVERVNDDQFAFPLDAPLPSLSFSQDSQSQSQGNVLSESDLNSAEDWEIYQYLSQPQHKRSRID
ncbi:hypothetical protein RCL1_000015 [Eukaryota sp. TZLM3-RCL]